MVCIRPYLLLSPATTTAFLSPAVAETPATQPVSAVISVERRFQIGDAIEHAAAENKPADELKWFRRLSDSEKKNVVKELNHYTVVIQDGVSVTDASNGSKTYHFTSEKPSHVTIEGDDQPDGRTKTVEAKISAATLSHAKGDGDRKTNFGMIQWELKQGKGIPLAPFTQAMVINIRFNVTVSANRHPKPH